MFRSIWEEVFWNSYQFEADNLWLRNFWPNGSAASGIKNREKDTVLPNFVVFTHMNSSVIPMLQRRMLKISSMAAGEAGRKKVLLQESASENPFEILIAQQYC